MKRMLFTPGPTEIPAEVLASQSRPIPHHRTDEYRQIFLEQTRLLQEHLGTTQPVLTLSASGSGAMEAALVNILSPGDEIIAVEGGKFGERWGKIAEAYGVAVHRVKVAYGRVATPQEVESSIAAHPNAKVVFVTHSETSTGALFPVHEIAKVVRAKGLLTVVDAVTSYGVYDLYFDASLLDAVVWGSQKGMMIPPGLGYVCYGPRAWAAAEKATLPKFYLNLTKARASLEKGDTPFTPRDLAGDRGARRGVHDGRGGKGKRLPPSRTERRRDACVGGGVGLAALRPGAEQCRHGDRGSRRDRRRRGREDDGEALRREDRGRAGLAEGENFPPWAHRLLRHGGHPAARRGI